MGRLGPAAHVPPAQIVSVCLLLTNIPQLTGIYSFFYLTGVNFQDCSVTYDIANDHLTLWLPYVDPRQILWFGKHPTAPVAQRTYDVDDARYNEQLASYFAAHLGNRTLYVLRESHMPAGVPLGRSSVNMTDLLPAMEQARIVKDEYEIAMIRRANDISSEAHLRVARNFLKMTNERHMEAMFMGVCDSFGSREMAYPVIAGGGVNGSTLHYGENNKPLKMGDNVVFDAGCEYNCYAADITRTLPVGGKFSTRGKAIMDIVTRMQTECVAGVKPGILFYELHKLAARIAAEGLKKLGVLRGSLADIEKAGTAAAFFPHGLGHNVGLDVHDLIATLPLGVKRGVGLEFGKRHFVSSEMLAAMGTEKMQGGRGPLQPGMVVTVEPGIYFCREYLEGFYRDSEVHADLIDWDVLEKYYPVGGARTEDCILVTDSGHENLTVAPKEADLLAVINGA